MKKFIAFTLAEVLIAVAIIGIVATLTVPNITANYRKKQFLDRAQMSLKLIDSAFYGIDELYYAAQREKTDSYTINQALFDKLKTNKKLSVKGTISDTYSNLPYTSDKNCSSGILNNGISIAICLNDTPTSDNPPKYGTVWFDTNTDDKKPNQKGADIFRAQLIGDSTVLVDDSGNPTQLEDFDTFKQ
ncbi:type II secretion system protein [bacterium]|nr:type II secretion system protein [bacterium]